MGAVIVVLATLASFVAVDILTSVFVALSIGLALIVLLLLVATGILVLKLSLAGPQWDKIQRASEISMRDMALWHQRRRQIALRTDILWQPRWFAEQEHLINLLQKRIEIDAENFSEHQKQEMILASQNALLETEEQWMRDILQLNIDNF
jgi:hypothetical protein